MKEFDLSPEGVLTPSAPIKSNGKRSKVKPNHPAASEKLFTIEWLGEANEDFLNGDITRAYTDKFGTTYGESLRGSWLPIGEEGENWSWVRYNPKKRCRIGAKRNPVGRHSVETPRRWYWVSHESGVVVGPMPRARAVRMMEDANLNRDADTVAVSERVMMRDYNGGYYKAPVKANGFKHAKSFGGSVGREQYHIHFEDAKGVAYYYAGNTDRGVKLEREYAKAKKFTAAKASALAKKMNVLYKNVRHDGGHFYAMSASDMPMKKNPVYRSTERDIGELRLERAADGIPYERSLSYSGSYRRSSPAREPEFDDGAEAPKYRDVTLTWSDGVQTFERLEKAMTLADARFELYHRDIRKGEKKRVRLVSVSPAMKPNGKDSYADMNEKTLRALIRQRDPNGYETLDDEGPTSKAQLIEALRLMDKSVV